ncbi:alpha/beta fold hydrolase [Paractinoplanes lichenicola]|uniref:Alpha/beta hydrolase n=1 Tax=Paractinoplanes lichenicola TaxID=2802976 RepID=A0ABS1VI68_9ACTN|nr:alpha/beta hydrolase [Actinoplanes lichenicola]MBL7254409.1 alpha/beta hydrolase [Actinoplanes lichenicola]
MLPQPPRRSTHATNSPLNRLVYDRWGEFGRPVVLLHGLLFDRTMWWPVAAELAGDCTVIAPDLPGHGQCPHRTDYSLERIAADLAALVHDLQLHRAPIVVGHGTSAWLAIAFADAYATHCLLTLDEPDDGPLNTVDDLVEAAGLAAVPEHYRPFAEPRRDPALLRAYAGWTAQPPTRRLAVAGSAGARSGPAPDNAFTHLSDPEGFAGRLRALL